MREQRLPRSWIGLFAAALVFGVVQVVGSYFIKGFRQGLDADMNPLLEQASVLDRAGFVGLSAVLVLPFIVGAHWVANRTSKPRRSFVLLLAFVPTALIFAQQVWWAVNAAFEPPMPVVPFEADDFFYLPNWLTLGFLVLGSVAASASFALLADRRKQAYP